MMHANAPMLIALAFSLIVFGIWFWPWRGDMGGLTDAQRRALDWLKDHGGDGCFDRHGIAFAQGETAPFARSTWNELERAGLIEFYGGKAAGLKGFGRLRVTPAGDILNVAVPQRRHGVVSDGVRHVVAKSGAE